MGILDLFRRAPEQARQRIEPAPPSPPSPQRPARAWLAAAPSRLLADLPGSSGPAPNKDIRVSLATLRNRSRWLSQNDGYSKGFLRTLRRNVIGANGIGLQMRVPDDRDPKKQDEGANQRIENAWAEWAAIGSCDITGRLSWIDLQGLVLTHVVRDGEALIRKIRTGKYNRHGFVLQVVDPVRLDEKLNLPAGSYGPYALPRGNSIRMGVELDPFNRPVAYHLLTTLPGDDVWQAAGRMWQRVAAAEMLHVFVTDWTDQVRGVPWLDTAIRPLAMLDGYSEAELVAARVSANKMGFYKLADNANRDDVPQELIEDARLVQESEAGTFEMLPPGVDFESFDPQHPNSAFKDFTGAILRKMSAGAGISYNAFANDPEGLNYSALRATALDDRDEYRTIQRWFIGAVCLQVFPEWLRETLLTGITGLPASKFGKFNAPAFVGRGWQWVDPQNEVAAARDAVALGIRSRTQIAAEQGVEIADIAADLRAEQDLLAGILPPAPASAPPPAQGKPANAA